MIGTLLNAATVLVGATIGSSFGARLPSRIQSITLQGLGLVTLLIGAQMALGAQNVLIVLASMLVGGIIGEILGIELRLERLGEWAERRFSKIPSEGFSANEGGANSQFVRGFVMSSLVFCVGPLTILGAIQDGLTGDFRLLAVKSVLDGFTAMVFSSVLGRGVYLSILVILVYQGGMSLGARLLGAGIPDPGSHPAILEMTAVGGLLILGIGFKLLEIKTIRVANFLPALLLAPLLTSWIGRDLNRLLGAG